MQTTKLNISRMKCGHCVQSVSDALNALDGVTATVSLEEATATVQSTDAIENSLLIKAVEDAGYGARVID